MAPRGGGAPAGGGARNGALIKSGRLTNPNQVTAKTGNQTHGQGENKKTMASPRTVQLAMGNLFNFFSFSFHFSSFFCFNSFCCLTRLLLALHTVALERERVKDEEAAAGGSSRAEIQETTGDPAIQTP